MRIVIAFFGLSVAVLACSAGSDSTGAPSSPPGESCQCTITLNGESKTLACGEDACIAGTSYQCEDGAKSVKGSACNAPPANTGTKPPAGQPPQKATTVPCKYHDFGTDKDIETCNAASEYCIRSYLKGLGPGAGNLCVPLPNGCAACQCASDNADSAWRKAKNNTVNCAKAVLACDATNGAITVDCIM